MRQRWKAALVAGVLAASGGPALAQAPAKQDASAMTADDIDACFRANFPKDSAVQQISLASKDRVGAISTSKATLWWKQLGDDKSGVLIRFESPTELRDAGVLMLEKDERNDMFMYLPELRKVKRITKHMAEASMFGTDFSYEEFERLQGIAEKAPSERAPDETVAGRAAYVVIAKPAPEQESGYERIKAWIDQETCVALKAEFYERGDAPRKLMTADPATLAQAGSVWYAGEVLQRDLRDETETVLRIEKIEVGVEVPQKLFSVRSLESQGR
jgi:hypothetical protein